MFLHSRPPSAREYTVATICNQRIGVVLGYLSRAKTSIINSNYVGVFPNQRCDISGYAADGAKTQIKSLTAYRRFGATHKPRPFNKSSRMRFRIVRREGYFHHPERMGDMTQANSKLLNAVASALQKEFQRKFLKKDFSTSEREFKGRPRKMHGSLSNLQKKDGTVNLQAVSLIARRAVHALRLFKGKGRLCFYSKELAGGAKSKAANMTSAPPARINLYWNPKKIRDEIGFLFHVKAFA
jgi:hypothetical protein